MKQQKSGSKTFLFIKNSGIAALFIGAAILLFGCENDIEKIKAFSSPENLPVLEAYDFTTTFSDSGQIRRTLKTPKLLSFENNGKAFYEFPEGMEIIQYNAKGEIVSSLSADYAKQFLKAKRWEAKNNVVATNKQGDTLKTEHLIWEKKDKKIYSEEFVKIIRKDGVYTGIGLTADESLQDWRIGKLKGNAYFDANNNKPNKTGRADTKEDLKNKKNLPFDRPLQLER
jgi:LPS export ABC transporter protein LptC